MITPAPGQVVNPGASPPALAGKAPKDIFIIMLDTLSMA